MSKECVQGAYWRVIVRQPEDGREQLRREWMMRRGGALSIRTYMRSRGTHALSRYH